MINVNRAVKQMSGKNNVCLQFAGCYSRDLCSATYLISFAFSVRRFKCFIPVLGAFLKDVICTIRF